MEYSLNLNCVVKVKLTDHGKDIYYHHKDEFNKQHHKHIWIPRYPKEDENGYSKFQLWDFISLYGNHIGMWKPNVILPLEIVIDENDLGKKEEE